MTQTQVRTIVKNMVNAGEPDSVIRGFIEEYKKRESLGKKSGSTKRASVGSSLAQKNMVSKSGNGLSVSPIKQKNPNAITIGHGDF